MTCTVSFINWISCISKRGFKKNLKILALKRMEKNFCPKQRILNIIMCAFGRRQMLESFGKYAKQRIRGTEKHFGHLQTASQLSPPELMQASTAVYPKAPTSCPS